MAYIYCADVYCEDCGERIKADLEREGKVPPTPDDERTFDSDEYPKGYCAEWEEADSPQNCVDCGRFLENQLTSEGYRYLKGMLDECGATLPPAVQEWADFYQFTYWQNPYESAQDWLTTNLREHTSAVKHTDAQYHVSTLFDMTVAIAEVLTEDQIQDLFQQDMEDDGFFKKTGWYSPEMSD